LALVSERLANAALGVSAVAWAILGLADTTPANRWSVVRVTLSALNACAGILFFRRAASRRAAPLTSIVASLPSVILAALALRFAPVPTSWPLAAEILFAAGGVAAMVSLAFLGRSFALFPSVRQVVVRGPFRFVRHPAYAAELAMVIACGLARSTAAAALLGALALGLVALRIFAEERILREEPDYRDYAALVRFRLLPGIW
jgi:protein-S-isoprenylcysteine O-methyltransferase Ste14